MNCQNGCFQRVRNLNVRPVPELESCLVYRPANPKLFMLNSSMWLLLELCEQPRSRAEIEREYAQAVSDSTEPEEASAQVAEGLASLQQDLLVETV